MAAWPDPAGLMASPLDSLRSRWLRQLPLSGFGPSDGRQVGQIIDWDHKYGTVKVLFPSFERLLATLAEQTY